MKNREILAVILGVRLALEVATTEAAPLVKPTPQFNLQAAKTLTLSRREADFETGRDITLLIGLGGVGLFALGVLRFSRRH